LNTIIVDYVSVIMVEFIFRLEKNDNTKVNTFSTIK